MAAYSSLTNLKRRVLELQQRGEKELLYTQNDNGVYQLMIGRFENQADAQVTYQRVVLELEVNDPYLVSLQTIR